VDGDVLWSKMRDFEDVIDFAGDTVEFRKSLLKYEKSLDQIRTLSLVFVAGGLLSLVIIVI
jgi:hypothetical protein